MTSRALHHQAREANRRLKLGAHPDLQSIQSWLEAKRGKPITIMELPTLRGDDLCGFWLSHPHRDVVVYAPPKSTLQLQFIVLHEFAHMILDHQLSASSLAPMHLPGFPETPLMTLGRSSFENDDEAAAEYLAELLAARTLPRVQDLQGEPSGFDQVFG
ncbi:hypothetical protein [Arthrobacter sp. STN4]|uniref:hypothetical protein n=1 Tax=Arthrobacter sp. STN4 TaxID=2923276 RepID=UPI00211A2CA3|nr:hypothetical protein [Arthrobacter sp. STN4]MCQ9163961.1 hypothetical protein [Arthrobacter sp. STN4]